MDKDREQKREKSLFELFGMGKKEKVSEEEIMDMVEGNDDLLDDEKRMIRDILDLGDMSVYEIMTPRVDMILVEDCETGRAALERMRGTGFSRLPIYHDDIDEIVGVVHYKDLIGPLMDGRIDVPVTKFMFEPMFVPETKDAFPLLSEMQQRHCQMAIVVDEYGGTAGLITLEDVVEEIVGEITDETDRDRNIVTELAPNAWRVDGRLPVEDAIELGWPVKESDDYETIAGWLLDTFDEVPKPGREYVFGDFQFKIEKMRRARISTIRVIRKEAE